ncbi:MAG: capsular polysaccharide biosynthesis protein [Myxococcota bacterium]|jgi:capsular polysaccharide export protein|nr:capsular polysaccharide biosynthesis protein [Myxococcota bacterium]
MTSIHRQRTVATFSRGIAGLANLCEFLDAQRVLFCPSHGMARQIDAVVGWGAQRNTQQAVEYAKAHGLEYLRLEDGFLRSVGLGVHGAAPLSIVIDRRGMYYDATSESDLEYWLRTALGESARLFSNDTLQRARRLMNDIVSAKLSKYNDSSCRGRLNFDSRFARRVLVVDQTYGDVSIRLGGVAKDGFPQMLEAAIAENPDAEIIVRTHPDVVAGKKRGCLGQIPRRERLTLSPSLLNPIDVLQSVDRVYVATSQLGFEALMVGKPVSCFGTPFYAGWGLTDDRASVPRRGQSRSLEQVFAAAYLHYPRYIDPDTGKRCEPERVIEHLSLQRRMFSLNASQTFCFGFTLWKRNHVRSYLRSPNTEVHFPRNPRAAERLGIGPSSRVVIWGLRETEPVRRLAERYGLTVSRMEDGFLRSVGLGSDLVAPSSLVIDSRGIYYDPTAPSDLEHILETTVFSDEDLRRAVALRTAMAQQRVSKYNLGEDLPLALDPAKGQKVVLVPGQVEDDASITRGCRAVCTNLALLQAVRAACPDDFVVFKPHPDVVSGNRYGAVPAERALALCNMVVEDVSIARCLDAAVAVHTMTSLVGFEALLRGLEVATYGQPFYSGWGLTRDRHPVERRTRTLSLDELVAGTLIHYPRYFNVVTGEFTTPEHVIRTLAEQRSAHKGPKKYKTSRIARQLRKLVHIYKGLRYAP